MPEKKLRHFLWLSVAVGKLFFFLDSSRTHLDSLFHGFAISRLGIHGDGHIRIIDGTGVDVVIIQSLQIIVKRRAEAVEIGHDEHQKANANEHPERTFCIGLSSAGGRAHSIHNA